MLLLRLMHLGVALTEGVPPSDLTGDARQSDGDEAAGEVGPKHRLCGRPTERV